MRRGLIVDLGGYIRAYDDEKKLYATLSKKSIESFSFWAVQLGLWFSFYWIAQSVILSRCCVPCISCLYLTQCECFVRNNTINDDAKCSFMITSSDFRCRLFSRCQNDKSFTYYSALMEPTQLFCLVQNVSFCLFTMYSCETKHWHCSMHSDIKVEILIERFRTFSVFFSTFWLWKRVRTTLLSVFIWC